MFGKNWSIGEELHTKLLFMGEKYYFYKIIKHNLLVGSSKHLMEQSVTEKGATDIPRRTGF